MNRICVLFFIAAATLAGPAPVKAQGMTRADSLMQARRHFSFAVQSKKSGEYRESLAQYEKSIALNDTVFQVRFSFAELLMLMELPHRAKAEYLRTLSLNPDHYPSAHILAGMYHAAAAFDSALIMYETMHRIKPEPSILAAIASVREYLGREEGALDALRALIARGENGRENLERAAILSLTVGDHESAVRFADAALEHEPEDRGLLRLAARTRLASGDREGAAERLARLSRIDSTDTGVLDELAALYRALGSRKDLALTLERRHHLAPRDAAIVGELAELLFAEGETMRAEQYARQGVEIAPKDGGLRIILADAHRRRGEIDRARAEYRAALVDPKWAETAKHYLDRLDGSESDAERKEREFFERGK